MGGRAAEELIFGEDEVTSGASSDIEQATKMARSMITQCGFSDEVGIVAATQDMSNATRGKIDAEVKRMTDASYKRAKDILQKYAFEHKLLAETLMEYETLSGDEVRDVVLRRKRPSRPSINKDGGARGDQSVLTAKSPITKPKSRIPGFGMYQSDE
jgi:ATP-dependent Zn protease